MSAALGLRGRWRRAALGLPTVLGLRSGGWFIPHRYASLLPPAGSLPPYPTIEALFRHHQAAFVELLDRLDGEADAVLALAELLGQSWFPALDAAAAFGICRWRKPRRVVEVGSGHSTRILSRALGPASSIAAIDPAPRADIADLPGVEIVPRTLQAAPLSLFHGLKAGDVLFIDSSHILMPGSDVDILLNRVLPGLPAGVLVHLHDIFLPFDYPATWGWRNYNEQLGVLPLLVDGAYVPLFSSVWMQRRAGDRLARSVVARLPCPAEAMPASLWLEKR